MMRPAYHIPSPVQPSPLSELTMDVTDESRPTTLPDNQPPVEERRLFRRYEFGLKAALTDGHGCRHACAIMDLSLGGAALKPGNPDWKGTTIRLAWTDLGLNDGLTARVVHATDNVAHLAFELDEAQESALTMFLVMSPATR